MDTLRSRNLCTAALSCLGLLPRGLPLPRGGPVLTPLARVFGLRIDRADNGKAGEDGQSESRIGPTIQARHIVTPDDTGHGGAALEGCSG